MAVTLIFGATGGVGSALARRLSATGRSLHLAARQEDRLGALASELGASMSVCDVLDTAEIERAVADAGTEIEGLAFAVGSIDLAPVRRLSRESMRTSFELNAVSAAECVRLALPGLQAASGAVVLFSTVAVAQGFSNHAIIAAAKGAVEGLVTAMAAELSPKVRVNAVAPSLLDTPLGESFTRDEKLKTAIAGLHAMGRLGRAEDAAAAAAFLLSKDADWITGQVLGVDGGRSRLRSKG